MTAPVFPWQVNGSLRVVGHPDKRVFEYLCDACGSRFEGSPSVLNQGHCGCGHMGTSFGRWTCTAVSDVGSAWWSCSCGNPEIKSWDRRRPDKSSCGCVAEEQTFNKSLLEVGGVAFLFDRQGGLTPGTVLATLEG